MKSTRSPNAASFFRAVTLMLLWVASSGIAVAQSAVVVEGQVQRPGEYRVQPDTRLLQVIQAAGVTSDAYLISAAWLSRSHQSTQRGLKAGLVFDLRTAHQDALLRDDAHAAQLVARLLDRVNEMPVTGRRLGTLDPVRLEVQPRTNRLLEPGDRLVFPPRPHTITVTGAVAADCMLPFSGLRAAADYVADCPLHPDADTSWIYLIQPDGTVNRRGVAGWNREPPQTLAPGATVYVPLRAAMLRGRAEELNDDFAAFLATQPLPLTREAQ